MKDLQVQLIRPPVPIRHGPSRRVSVRDVGLRGSHPSPGICMAPYFSIGPRLRVLVIRNRLSTVLGRRI